MSGQSFRDKLQMARGPFEKFLGKSYFYDRLHLCFLCRPGADSQFYKKHILKNHGYHTYAVLSWAFQHSNSDDKTKRSFVQTQTRQYTVPVLYGIYTIFCKLYSLAASCFSQCCRTVAIFHGSGSKF
jgi:hypothetical protein